MPIAPFPSEVTVTFRAAVLAGAVALFVYQRPPVFAQSPVPDPAQGPYGRGPSALTASVKFEVSPRQTEVFIDGYYAGIADDFDGAFQQLRIEPGDHEVQLFLAGYRLSTEKISPTAGGTVKVRRTMERLGAGEAEPQRPTAAPRAERVAPRRPQIPIPPRPASPPVASRPERQGTGAGESAPSASGTVTIRVQPVDAQVFVDGERWSTSGDDERLVVQLAAGLHTIEVRKSGYRGYLTEVNVRGGETLPVNISLAKAP